MKKTATEFWQEKFNEPPQNDSEKLAITMMAEYADHVSNQVEAKVKPEIADVKEQLLIFQQKLRKIHGGMARYFKPKENMVILDFIATINENDLQ